MIGGPFFFAPESCAAPSPRDTVARGGTSMSDLVCEKHDHVAVIKLNRPDRMNAISHEMLTALGVSLEEFDKDPEIRAIILTGEGRGFCSGLDLKDTVAGRGI